IHFTMIWYKIHRTSRSAVRKLDYSARCYSYLINDKRKINHNEACFIFPYKFNHVKKSNCKSNYPFFNPHCGYHALSIKNDKKYEMQILHVCSDPLGKVTNTRHLSLEWLDSLTAAQSGWFQGLARSAAVENVMGSLQAFHDMSHLPWWASIIISTVVLRTTLTLPLSIYQEYILAKVTNLRPKMDKLVIELKRETAFAIKKFGWTEKKARIMYNKSAKKIWDGLIVEENCHPAKAAILVVFQIPLWVSISLSLRNMASMMPHQDTAAQILFMEMSTGGFGWIPNLTEVDHSLVIPVAFGLTNLILTETFVLLRLQEQSKIKKISTNFFRVLSIAMIPIAASVPSCVSLYWLTSSTCALVQRLILLSPMIRHKVGIPYSPLDISHPYQHLWNKLKERRTPFSKEKT
ncbi:unnamed protein product, partial [Meganyctiphanes norvegica]